MFTTAHLASGVAVGLALGLDGWPLAAFVLASVFTDWDYSIQLLTGRNHRTLVTHSPPVYIAVLLPLGFVERTAWFVLAGSLLHFSLDLWEYGLRLNPFKNEIFGARLIPGIERMRFRDYFATYWRDRRFVAAEVAFALGAVGLAALRLAV